MGYTARGETSPLSSANKENRTASDLIQSTLHDTPDYVIVVAESGLA